MVLKIKIPTSFFFRVSWHATLIRVKKGGRLGNTDLFFYVFHFSRNRSKTRRRSGTNADNNPENQGDDYNHNEQTNFRFANTDQTTEDSDTNLIKQSQKNDPPTHRPVYRSSSQTSTASRRHHHHHHHRRTNSKSSNKNVKQGLNCDEDAMRMIMRRERSRKSLHHNTNNQQSETCHETSADENEEEILRRQVRRRKVNLKKKNFRLDFNRVN